MMKRSFLTLPVLLTALALLAACDKIDIQSAGEPMDAEYKRREKLGKLSGEGLVIGGASDQEGSGSAGNNPLGVNAFLWRAALDTVSFMPISAADPFGGVILTDWYEDPNARSERFKITVLILDRQLRADSVKVSLFRQTKNPAGDWQDEAQNAETNRKLEDTLLTRARQLRVITENKQ